MQLRPLLAALSTLSLTIMLFPSIAVAKTYHVLKAGTIGNFGEQGAAFRALIETTINERDGDRIVTDPKKAETLLQPKIIETGDNYLLFLDIIQGDEVISSRVIKIKGFDELDIATERLVTSTLDSKPVRQTIEVGKVTRSEQDRQDVRINAKNYFYLGFGPAVGSGLRNKDGMVAFDIGLAREFDANIVKALISIHSGLNKDRSSLSGLGLGVQHVFSNQDIAPFLGGQLLYGGATGNYPKQSTSTTTTTEDESDYGQTKSGFSVGLSAGYMLFRTSSVHMDAGFGIRTFLGRLDSGNPTTYAFTLGLYL